MNNSNNYYVVLIGGFYADNDCSCPQNLITFETEQQAINEANKLNAEFIKESGLSEDEYKDDPDTPEYVVFNKSYFEANYPEKTIKE